MNIKHEAQYKKLGVELELKEIELKDLEQKKAFCELQFFFLRVHHFALMKKGTGSTHTHIHATILKSNLTLGQVF
jgi:hypothetical protein